MLLGFGDMSDLPSGDPPEPAYHYVAYIDESGEPGLTRVKPLDQNGSSEWLILSAVVIQVEHENQTGNWISEILRRINSRHRTDVHFSELEPRDRVIAASGLLPYPMRCFVVCSNKKNMKGYRNPRPEKMANVDWFYAWMTRVILERVTHFVAMRSKEKFNEVKRVKIVFSERGGLSVSQMGAYYSWIEPQSKNKNLVLPWGDLQWETLSLHLLKVKPHQRTPGLQLADIVASSFFKACDKYDTGECDSLCARILYPRMARFPDWTGRFSGYGVKLLPNLAQAKLEKDQMPIFLSYGYPLQLWQDGMDWSTTPPWRKNLVAGPSDPTAF